jgi:hypothetical protein
MSSQLAKVNCPIVNVEAIGERYKCTKCPKTFTRKYSLDRHLKEVDCTLPKVTVASQQMATIQEMFTLLHEREKREIERDKREAQREASSLAIPNQPILYAPVTNLNNLQIMCLSTKDNLLDILAARENLPNALTYIKDCALSRLAGDCRILEKAYKLVTEQPAIMYANKSKTKFVYYDERRRRTVESSMAAMAKKLADILSNSYLKGMQSFGVDLSGEVREDYIPCGLSSSSSASVESAIPKLEPYDLDLWNAHIHELRDEKYQRKLLRNLKIPFEDQDDD